METNQPSHLKHAARSCGDADAGIQCPAHAAVTRVIRERGHSQEERERGKNRVVNEQ